MGKLLKIEWLKIRRYKALLWLAAVFCVSVFGINYIIFDKTSLLTGSVGPAVPDLFGQPFAFPLVWQTVSFLTGFLLVIPGLIIIMLTANEFTFRTHRQSVINGLSRKQFMAGKIGLIFTVAVVITALVVVMSLLFGIAGSSPFSAGGSVYCVFFFVQALTYMSVAFLLVMLFRRSGISIGIFFLYAFIIENLASLFLNHKVVSGWGYYLPVKAANKLIPAPVNFPGLRDYDIPAPEYLLIACLFWIAVCLGLSVYKFGKSDL